MSQSRFSQVSGQAWFAILAGFVVGLLALGLASLSDLVTAELALNDLAQYWPQYAMAGGAFALFSWPLLRRALTAQDGETGAAKRSVYAGTASLALFAAVTLWLSPKFPVRWLLYYYAISVFLDWLLWRFVTRLVFSPASPTSRLGRVAAYFDRVPHAPFVLAAFFLLALTPILLFANQSTPAERVANWAFGLLTVAVVAALLEAFMAGKVKRLEGQESLIGGALLIVGLIAVGYASESAHTIAETSFLVDTQPSYLARVVTNQDLVVTDSPKLRLGNIPDMTPHLDLSPDQRGTALWDDLNRDFQGKRNIYWVSVPGDSHDTRQVLAAYLQSNGCLDDTPGTILPVKPYELRAPLAAPKVLPPDLAAQISDAFKPAQVDFGAIQMTGYNSEPKVCSHDAVAVALRWGLPQTTDSPLKLYLALTDTKGRVIATQDLPIADEQQRTTDQLPAGTSILGYYLIVVPFGTPPGEYQLSAGAYKSGESQRLHVNQASGVPGSSPDLVALGPVQVYRAADLASDPYKSLADSKLVQSKTDLVEGLRLAAYGVSTQQVLPGEKVSLTARWRALVDSMPSYSITVSLRQGGQTVAETSGTPADGTYPTSQWKSNEVVQDRWDVRVPPDARGGPAQLQIGVDGGKTIYLADVNIQPVTHTFQLPGMSYQSNAAFASVAGLAGYDLASSSVSASRPISLTLYWVPASSTIDQNFTVFAQLLAADGRLIAQSDSEPAGGQRPTLGWVKGEVVADQHELEFGDKSYRGAATLIVGLYDPTTGVRVPVQASADNFAKLGTTLQVSP